MTVVPTGNTKIAGLVADLHLTGVQSSLCIAILLVRVGWLLLWVMSQTRLADSIQSPRRAFVSDSSLRFVLVSSVEV